MKIKKLFRDITIPLVFCILVGCQSDKIVIESVDDIIFTTAGTKRDCKTSRIQQGLSNDEIQTVVVTDSMLVDTFGNDFFLRIQDVDVVSFGTAEILNGQLYELFFCLEYSSNKLSISYAPDYSYRFGGKIYKIDDYDIGILSAEGDYTQIFINCYSGCFLITKEGTTDKELLYFIETIIRSSL